MCVVLSPVSSLGEDEAGGSGEMNTDGGEANGIHGEQDGLLRTRRAPSATVEQPGRGPSQAADFFSARGAPSILEVSNFSGGRQRVTTSVMAPEPRVPGRVPSGTEGC